MSERWKKAVIFSIHKKAIDQCDNYREIVLLDVTYKILNNYNIRRLKEADIYK